MTQSRRINVLLVEDNLAHAKITWRAFASTPVLLEIHHVTDGQAALDAVFNRGEYADRRKYPRPDLILVDVRLPVIDGFEVLRKIKEAEGTRGIPVVMISTSDNPEDVRRSYELGASSYLVKPVDLAVFTQKLVELIHFWVYTADRPMATPAPAGA